jgi:hypothetical protein
MKVYKFVFAVGLLNMTIPFLGFPLVYKHYALVTIGVFAVLYALYVRAIIKEEEAGLIQKRESVVVNEDLSIRTIEQVVEMHEVTEVPRKKIVSDVTPKRRGRKPKVVVNASVQEDMYE